MTRFSFLLLAFLTHLGCAEDAYAALSIELQAYLPEQVTAVVVHKGTATEHVRIHWEKPFTVYAEVINGPENGESHTTSLDHDPIGIRIIANTSLKEIYAHKARYFAMKSGLVQWEARLKDMPGIDGKNWAFGGPEGWLKGASPKTDAEKGLVADYEAFLASEYRPVMAWQCPNLIFKGRFILIDSVLDWQGHSFAADGADVVRNLLQTIESRCEGIIERY